MNLVVDIGNSRVKAAAYDDGKIVGRWETDDFDRKLLCTILQEFPGIRRSIVASSRAGVSQGEQLLPELVELHIHFDALVETPLKNLYHTPQTMGADRLAAAVGAYGLYPGRNTLIVDMGTAITIDLVTSAGEFEGGNISPGVGMRFRALNEFTGRLPLIGPEDAEDDDTEHDGLVGKTTRGAIWAGVINGTRFELEGYIDRMGEKFDDLNVIFTGGHAKHFAGKLKNTIFADYDLVLTGLNTILNYNAEHK